MLNYLKKPYLRKNIIVTKGDKLPEQPPRVTHYTEPLPTNAAIPEKSDEQKKVEFADDKVVAARERKKEQATRAQGKKPSGSSRPPAHGKRAREPSTRRGSKKIRLTASDSPFVDLDSAESVPNPKPIRSIIGLDVLESDGAEGSEPSGGSEAGMFSFILSIIVLSRLLLSKVHAFYISGGSKGKDPLVEEEEDEHVDIEGDDEEDDEFVYVPGWSVTRGSRMNNSTVCRDIMVNMATPAEDKYIASHTDAEAVQRAWLLLGKQASAQVDLIFRYETLMAKHDRLSEKNKELQVSLDKNWKMYGNMATELKQVKDQHAECANKDPEELVKLKAEHASCPDREAALKD